MSESTSTSSATTGADKEESVTVRDNRTGKEVTIPIRKGTIRAADLKKIGLR